MPTATHIVPLIVGDARLCKAASDILLEKHNVYIQPINYPTVPKGTERLRITPTPLHTDEMIIELAPCAGERMGEPRAAARAAGDQDHLRQAHLG
jgi:7-keto-8-aminopelargonate synthetase-like enzyme